jgi:hypothetical protein
MVASFQVFVLESLYVPAIVITSLLIMGYVKLKFFGSPTIQIWKLNQKQPLKLLFELEMKKIPLPLFGH